MAADHAWSGRAVGGDCGAADRPAYRRDSRGRAVSPRRARDSLPSRVVPAREPSTGQITELHLLLCFVFVLAEHENEAQQNGEYLAVAGYKGLIQQPPDF